MVEHQSMQQMGERETQLSPSTEFASPMGAGAPASVQMSAHSQADLLAMNNLAQELLHDPLAMRLLCDRVYDLMAQDLQIQQDRDRGYGRR
jgi:hypothetical protein